MEIMYLCHELTAEDAERDEKAIRRFPEEVHRILPEKKCAVFPLSTDLVDEILRAAEEQDNFQNFVNAVLAVFFKDITKTINRSLWLVLCCNPDWTLATKIKTENSVAQWGCQLGPIAVIYKHDPYLIWHEMFHMLHANDCYEVTSTGEINNRTCGESNCIMQYAPTAETLGPAPPFICNRNVERMRKGTAQ